MLSCRKVMDHNCSTSNFGGLKLKLQLKSSGWVCAKTSRRRRKFYCASCGGIFQSSFKLQRHIKLHHASEGTLPGIDPRTRSHATKSTSERKYSCNWCQKVQTKDNISSIRRDANRLPLHSHERIDDDRLRALWECRGLELSKSGSIHQDQQPSAETSIAAASRSHLIDHFRCSLLDLITTTTTAKKLRDHKRIHNHRSFSCNYCSKKFTLLKYLNRHIREVHLKLQRFKCNDCGRGFTRKQNFDRHRNVHNSTFDFTCVVCGRPFIRMDSLRRHNKSHKTHEFKLNFYPTDQT